MSQKLTNEIHSDVSFFSGVIAVFISPYYGPVFLFMGWLFYFIAKKKYRNSGRCKAAYFTNIAALFILGLKWILIARSDTIWMQV